MAITQLTFNNNLNTSLQIGDVVYYCPVSSLGGFNSNSNEDQITKLGTVLSIFENTIQVTLESNTLAPNANDYIFFSKDNIVNLNSVLGYFASVKMVNDSTEKAELFSISLGTDLSSK